MSEAPPAKRDAAPPIAPNALPLAPETVGPFLRAKLRGLQRRLEATQPRILAVEDKDAVHDLRVALRQTRTVLAAGGALFGRHFTDQVRRALGDVQHATGALRDEEVLLDLLGSLDVGADRADVEMWLGVRRRRERTLRTRLRRVVRAGDLDRGIRLLDALLAFAVKPARDKSLAKFARRAIEDAKRNAERLRSAAEETRQGEGEPETVRQTEARHSLRIGYKRLRYIVETFADAPGGELATPLARFASRFQTLLGRIHDADVAEAAVRRARGLARGARVSLLRELAAHRAVRLRAYDKACGVTAESKPLTRLYASGTDSLRKTSTR